MTLPFSPDALATAAALVLAHAVADFLLQTDKMVKHKQRPSVFARHIAIVGLTAWIALGGAWHLALIVALTHGGIDAIKTWALPPERADTLSAYLGDQAAHLLTIGAVALWEPTAFAFGLWAEHLSPAFYLWPAGLLMATLAGGPAIGLLMKRFESDVPKGLPHAGRMIGLLERGLIFVMVLVGEPAGIGFLIAAKSILRFDTASQDQRASEYVIIGTLASFGWAMLAAFATQHALSMAP